MLQQLWWHELLITEQVSQCAQFPSIYYQDGTSLCEVSEGFAVELRGADVTTTLCRRLSFNITTVWSPRSGVEAPNSCKVHIWAERERTQKARNLLNRSFISKPLHWVISAGCTGVSGSAGNAPWTLDLLPASSRFVQLKCWIPSYCCGATMLSKQRGCSLCVMWDLISCLSQKWLLSATLWFSGL